MPQKRLRVFLLCMMCTLCLYGNCSAERWVQYFVSFGDKIFMDIDSIKALEYKGRKYLGVYVKGNLVASISKELYVLVDLENERKLELNKSCILNGQIDDRYFDILINTPQNNKIVSPKEYVVLNHGKLPVEQAFMQCVEQNRPDIIKEIRTFNGSNTPSAGAQTVTAGGDYGFPQMLGDGPVQFVPRMVHKPPTQPTVGDGITRSYVGGVPASGIHCEHGQFVPSIAPDSGKLLYIIYRASDSAWVHQKNVVEYWIIGIFSYDDETDTFTLYESANCTPYKTMHIIDKNQIEIERWSSATGVSQDNPEHFIAKYEKAIIGPEWEDTSFRHCDTDGYGWMLLFDDAPEDEHLEIGGWDWLTASNRVTQETSDGRVLEYSNEVGVDGLFAFLARKGKVGYAPPTSSTAEYIMKAAEDFQASTGHLKYQ